MNCALVSPVLCIIVIPCNHVMYAYPYSVKWFELVIQFEWSILHNVQKVSCVKNIFKKCLPLCQDTFKKHLEDTRIFKIKIGLLRYLQDSILHLHTHNTACVMGFHPAKNLGFRSRVMLRHGTDRQTDRRTDRQTPAPPRPIL